MYVIDPQYIGRDAVLVGVDMCTKAKAATSSNNDACVAFNADIGEIRVSQPLLPIPGETREDAQYRFMVSGSLRIRRQSEHSDRFALMSSAAHQHPTTFVWRSRDILMSTSSMRNRAKWKAHGSG